MKITTMVRFINHKGVYVHYQSIYQIVSGGKKMSFRTAYKLNTVFKEKDILEWKETTGAEFVAFFEKKIPKSFLNEPRDLKHKKERIIRRYGDDITDDMERLRVVPFSTLQEVADKHGFSREYARQIYQSFFGEPYTRAFNKKAKKKKDISCVHNPKRKVGDYKKGSYQHVGAVAEKLFMCRCELFGLDVGLMKTPTVDLIVNGWLVDVKSSHKNKKTETYRFGVTPVQFEMCDFFACYGYDDDCFYIIPNEKKGQSSKGGPLVNTKTKGSKSGFTVKTSAKVSKFTKYINRFDLLTTNKEVSK